MERRAQTQRRREDAQAPPRPRRHPHLVDADGRSALHHAAHVGAEKCVRRLLRSGAKNVPDKAGMRPSDLARSFEHASLIPLLEKAT